MRIKFNSIISDLLTQEQLLMKKIEIAQIKKQIDMIASFLPDELLRLTERELTQTHHYVGVLMMTQICGFTALTEKYNKIGKGGIYKLTATMNAYIGSLIETFYYYGADVLKFSGEILLTLWKVKPDSSIYEILHEVIVCALALQQILGNFETEINVTLQLKLSITCGNMSFSVIGDYNAKNYFIVGDAIIEAKDALGLCNNGDIMIGPGAWAHILHERYEVSSVDNGFVKVWKIYYKPNETSKKKLYEDKQIEVIKLIEKHIALRDMLHSRNKFESSLTMTKIIEQFVQSLPPRVEMKQASKYWKVNELRPFIIKPIQDQVDESQPVEYLTDMREVTMQCIKLLPNMLNESTIVVTLKEAYAEIYRISCLVLGVISKVVLLDKDIMIIVMFGLKSVRHEFESQNALRSGFEIKKALSGIIGVSSVSVAVTSGFIYCGVIGHPLRREYAIIGSAFNRAIKMTNVYANAVSCDKKTFKMSRLSSFYFLLLSQYRTRDDDLGQVFEYNEEFEDVPVALEAGFSVFGREAEFNLIRAVVYGDKFVENIRGLCIDGKESLGKTAIVQYSFKQFKQSDSYNIASVVLTPATKTPYYAISQLYRQLYDNRTRLHNNDAEILLNLPRDIKDHQDELRLAEDELAYRRYQVMRCVRNMLLCSEKTTLMYVDNFEWIDRQSWEILNVISAESNFRMIASSNFAEPHSELRFKVALNDNIKIYQCRTIDVHYIPDIICQFLNVNGVPRYMVDLLEATCEGRPGYIKNCLLRLLNEHSITFKLINVFEKNEERYIYPPLSNRKIESEILTIATFSELYEKNKHEVLTIAAISLDLYDSLPPYHQLVIKTASVLGELFIRTLLVVALKYPAEQTLAKVIQTLFEDEIFDCGSKYVNGDGLANNFTEPCCACYFEPHFFTTYNRHELPKYAFCKIIYYKNASIRQVAYDLLPDNQKKELHLMCTDVLEYMTHHCPKCIHQPTNAFVNFGLFKEILLYCSNTVQAQPYVPEPINSEEIKDCIRCGLYYNLNENGKGGGGVKYAHSTQRCNCLEISARTFKSLIYHSESAGHLGKRIFFTMRYGLNLICLDDHIGAIEVLSEARELCMNDAKTRSKQITDTFRRLHMGKINYGLAKAFTDLHQLRTAKNYLAIALRQYNIPTVAMNYKNFKFLLTRSFLVNVKRLKPLKHSKTMAHNDLGGCLALCGKLFYLEGRWDLSKLCCAYSIFIMKTINPSIPILYEVYCNAMDVYKHCDHAHTCERLIKFVKRDLQSVYANNNTQDFYRLAELLNNIFHIKYISGDICGGIRLGYRILDISLELFSQTCLDVQILLVTLLIYNFRLHDSLMIGALIRNNLGHGTRLSVYYISNLVHVMRAGIQLEDIETAIDYARAYHFGKPKESTTWLDYFFHAVIWTYYMHIDKHHLAKEWRFEYQFNKDNTNRLVVLNTLMYATEARLYNMLRMRRHNLPDATEVKIIARYLDIIDARTSDQYKILRPQYLLYRAWFCKLRRKHRDATNLLQKARQICEKQENWMFKCWTDQIEYGWLYPTTVRSEEITLLSTKDAIDITMAEWSKLMKPLPLM